MCIKHFSFKTSSQTWMYLETWLLSFRMHITAFYYVSLLVLWELWCISLLLLHTALGCCLFCRTIIGIHENIWLWKPAPLHLSYPISFLHGDHIQVPSSSVLYRANIYQWSTWKCCAYHYIVLLPVYVLVEYLLGLTWSNLVPCLGLVYTFLDCLWFASKQDPYKWCHTFYNCRKYLSSFRSPPYEVINSDSCYANLNCGEVVSMVTFGIRSPTFK